MRVLQNYYYTSTAGNTVTTSYKDSTGTTIFIDNFLNNNIVGMIGDTGTMSVLEWLTCYDYIIHPLVPNNTYRDVLALPLNEGN